MDENSTPPEHEQMGQDTVPRRDFLRLLGTGAWALAARPKIAIPEMLTELTKGNDTSPEIRRALLKFSKEYLRLAKKGQEILETLENANHSCATCDKGIAIEKHARRLVPQSQEVYSNEHSENIKELATRLWAQLEQKPEILQQYHKIVNVLETEFEIQVRSLTNSSLLDSYRSFFLYSPIGSITVTQRLVNGQMEPEKLGTYHKNEIRAHLDTLNNLLGATAATEVARPDESVVFEGFSQTIPYNHDMKPKHLASIQDHIKHLLETLIPSGLLPTHGVKKVIWSDLLGGFTLGKGLVWGGELHINGEIYSDILQNIILLFSEIVSLIDSGNTSLEKIKRNSVI